MSIFALNLILALGLALAIDYTLLIVSRFRDEVARGDSRDEALLRTMSTAGRTVLFSAVTVALSMVSMMFFPMPFLQSFAYAGVAAVAFAALAAMVVTPAALVLLGERLDSWMCVASRVGCSAGRSRSRDPSISDSSTAGRKPLCGSRFRSVWLSSGCCSFWARRSSASNGAIQTTACYRAQPGAPGR